MNASGVLIDNSLTCSKVQPAATLLACSMWLPAASNKDQNYFGKQQVKLQSALNNDHTNVCFSLGKAERHACIHQHSLLRSFGGHVEMNGIGIFIFHANCDRTHSLLWKVKCVTFTT